MRTTVVAERDLQTNVMDAEKSDMDVFWGERDSAVKGHDRVGGGNLTI